MKLSFTIKSLILTSALVTMSPLAVSAEDAKPSKVLEIKGKYCLKTEVGHSMMGPTATGIYYVFTDKKAVLLVTINNKNKDFPVSAKIFNFADDTTQQGMDRWVNNQHSDAIFPDVPKPLKTHKIPADVCKVISKKLVNTSESRGAKYENFSVEFQLKDVPVIGSIKLNDLSDVATVRVNNPLITP
jgi:hypothetical protein